MSTARLGSWGTWQQTRNSLSQSLAMNVKARNESAAGSEKEDQLNENISQALKDIQAHGLNGLRMVDLAIADQVLVEKIKSESANAKKEADRIREATASVEKLTGLVQNLTKLVAMFLAL